MKVSGTPPPHPCGITAVTTHSYHILFPCCIDLGGIVVLDVICKQEALPLLFLPGHSLLKHTSTALARAFLSRARQQPLLRLAPPSRLVLCCFFLFCFVWGTPLSRRREQDVRNDGQVVRALGRGASVAGQQRQDPDRIAGEVGLVAQEQHQASGRAKPSVTWRQGVKGHAFLAK